MLVGIKGDLVAGLGFFAFCGALDGEGVHHAQGGTVIGDGDAVGGDGEFRIRDRHLGDVGGFLLVHHRGVGEALVRLDVVILGAGGGVGGDIQDAVRVSDRSGGCVRAVCVFVTIGFSNLGKAVHHVAAGVHMVVTHEHHINVKLFEHRD